MEEITCTNLDRAIEEYKSFGYRLDMIFPADNPREALVSKDGERLRLSLQKPAREQGRNLDVDQYALADAQASAIDEWIVGRAGMEYRDLIPDRMNGKVIASHIRLRTAGEVPDYVHYHKIDFQMIYCKRGRIRVVYEDQGPPFWLETGDCVLQPPEIRHRVLECTAGAEVIEVSMPAEHETWVEHDIELPTRSRNPSRDFNGQCFMRHIAAESSWMTSDLKDFEERRTGIAFAAGGLVDLRVLRSKAEKPVTVESTSKTDILLYFVLTGSVFLTLGGQAEREIAADNGFLLEKGTEYSIRMSERSELLSFAA
ncbi:MAG: cupin [Pyrinomonadaceae bacterium]